ncbi:MAG: alpha-L-fucosidase [Clostridia bacterium]|nr:alpha-L-fucosidase [Clostridia bacterium]
MTMKNRFGMFIHWGIYAIPAFHEQALARADWPYEQYEALKDQFNPVNYDPRAWVKTAKDAGMEYICFTAKHHDGFCMWDTKETDYNIMHTPYGRDVLKELSDACREAGMRLSIYYSNPDWYNEYAYNAASSHQWKAKYPERADHEKYLSFVKAQVKELLTNYGPIYTFFWDIPPMIDDPSVNDYLRSLQPDILINDRGYDKGDFSTPERTVPDGERFPNNTEACQSVGEQSWGYREKEDYYSAHHLMASIDKIMAMGGSYLLNVGPRADGTFPPEAERLVLRVGDWYNRVRDALQDTTPDSRGCKVAGGAKYVAVEKNGKTYLHFYAGLTSTAVTLEAPEAVPVRARLLNSGEELPIRYEVLPCKNDSDAVARKPYASVWKIPVDDYPAEPLVIELEW